MSAIDSRSSVDLAAFRRRCAELTGGDRAPLGIAVSGGGDSLALLKLAADAFPEAVQAATVDHGLREESAGEAAFVRRICDRIGVPHTTLRVRVEAGNLQHRAREARYRAMADWMRERGLASLATAHHADDQAETLVMRLNRGSGVAGLAGIRPLSRICGVRVIRPLLDWRREDLRRLVERAGWTPVEDPTNDDDGFDRIRVRKWLAGSELFDSVAAARSAAHLADADEALEWVAADHFSRLEREGQRIVVPVGWPKELAIRVMILVVRELGGKGPRGGDLARMHDALLRGEVATLGGVVARPGKAVWRFGAEPERNSG